MSRDAGVWNSVLVWADIGRASEEVPFLCGHLVRKVRLRALGHGS